MLPSYRGVLNHCTVLHMLKISNNKPQKSRLWRKPLTTLVLHEFQDEVLFEQPDCDCIVTCCVLLDRYTADRGIRLSVEEASLLQLCAVQNLGNDDHGDQDERFQQPNHDRIHTTCSVFLYRCVGTLVTGFQRCLGATCRFLSCCDSDESVECDVECNGKLPVPESSPSQVSTQAWGWDEKAISEMMFLHPTHDFLRTIPVYPWMDTQAD